MTGPPIWTYKQFQKMKYVEPFDVFAYESVLELISPDEKSQFLIMVGISNLNSAPSTFYAIEAPRNCEQRKAFEWGDISWIEYWSHKPWLLEIVCPWEAGALTSNYIGFEDLHIDFVKELENLGTRFPYEIKREVLERRCAYVHLPDSPFKNADRDYQEFMMKYGHRFAKIAA